MPTKGQIGNHRHSGEPDSDNDVQKHRSVCL